MKIQNSEESTGLLAIIAIVGLAASGTIQTEMATAAVGAVTIIYQMRKAKTTTKK